MLSALLTTIQSSLAASRSFVIGSFFPVLSFTLAMIAMLCQLSDRTRAWVTSLNAAQQGLYAAAVTVAVLAGAYAFSTFSVFLRETLEGKHLWKAAGSFSAAQHRELEALEARIRDLDFETIGLGWVTRLQNAFRTGSAKTDACSALPPHLSEKLNTLSDRRRRGELIHSPELSQAVADLSEFLSANNPLHKTPEGQALRAAQDELTKNIHYTASKYQYERIRLFNLRQFRYPGTFSDLEPVATVNILAPTRLGNIAHTVRSYAMTRYGMDLDIFYSRLQKILQGQAAFFGGLQDAKVQLDFLIALCWLTGLFTAVWTFVFPWVSHSYGLFLGAVILGPALTRLWYNLACQSYVALADILRSSVDLFRFDLLKELHVPLPYGTAEEKQVWHNLNQWIGYDQGQPFTYKHL